MNFPLIQSLTESVFDSLFTYDESKDQDSDAELHHSEQCNHGNWLNITDLEQVQELISKGDIPAGFVVFDKSVTGPNPRNDAMDFVPKAMVYLQDDYHLETDVFKKLAKLLSQKGCSNFVEPVFV